MKVYFATEQTIDRPHARSASCRIAAITILLSCLGVAPSCMKNADVKATTSSPPRTEASPATAAMPAANVASEKNLRTPAQRKLDSNLVLAIKRTRHEAPFDRPIALEPSVKVRADGRIVVDLKAEVTSALLEEIEQHGGDVLHSFAAAREVRALVPLMQLETLAERADVKFIATAAEATTNRPP